MIPWRALTLGSLLVLGALALPGAAAHYAPVAGDGFTYTETISVSGGWGDYRGYTETTYVNGSINVTTVAMDGTESAKYANTDHYVNSSGANLHWPESGTFTFSAVNFSYVQGTDNQTGYVHPSVWFFMNNSLAPDDRFTDLDTSMEVISTSYDYALGTAAGAYVETVYAIGSGQYLRDDSYGNLTASYTWQSYYDPATGYIVGYMYTETDRNSSGDGFTLVDHLAVTHTSYPLTAGSVPPQYAVTFAESGLSGGTSWSVIFNGVSRSGTGGSIVFDVPAGTYAYEVGPVEGYSVSVAGGLTTISQDTTLNLTFAAASGSSSPFGGVVLLGLLVVVVLVVVLVVWALVRRARRGPAMPRHSARGQVTFAPPVGASAPPPISLSPTGQPAVQQIVVKETVKVNCRYCGSLIDSTVTNCPYCGAART